jgi:hypothetical protein
MREKKRSAREQALLPPLFLILNKVVPFLRMYIYIYGNFKSRRNKNPSSYNWRSKKFLSDKSLQKRVQKQNGLMYFFFFGREKTVVRDSEERERNCTWREQQTKLRTFFGQRASPRIRPVKIIKNGAVPPILAAPEEVEVDVDVDEDEAFVVEAPLVVEAPPVVEAPLVVLTAAGLAVALPSAMA